MRKKEDHRDHLSDVTLEAPGLAERMAAFTVGQASWPVLPARNWCSSCENYRANVSEKVRGGRCLLVKEMTRRAGKVFDGEKAVGCSRHSANA